MDLLSVIRRWHFRDGKPIREIERRTGLSRNTIRKYLRSGTIEPKFKVPERPSKLDPYSDKLTTWLRIEAGKSRKQRRTVKQMTTALLDVMYGLPADTVEGRRLGNTSSRPAVEAPSYRWSLRRARPSSSTGARSGRSWAASAPSCRWRIPSCRTAGRLSCVLTYSRPTRCCSMR